MNLAEIRRKAQRGETAESPLVTAPAAAAPQQAPKPFAPAVAPAPEPAPACAAAEPAAAPTAVRAATEAPAATAVPAAAPAASAPAAPATEQAAAAPAYLAAVEPAPEAVPFEWRAEPMDDLLPSDFSFPEESERFDPAAVILRGRQTVSADQQLTLGEEVGTATSLELLCFKVGREEYAISIMDIKEIIKPREVTEVPRVPSFVRGILSLRGIIIPIFDMRVRLGLPGVQASERERVIVVARQSGFCGVLVDEVVQVVRIPESGIEPPPVVLEGIDRDFVQGIGRVGGRMLILLDMEKVLDVSLL
ncbi:MAG TPA: chemotaxis protein CheW [Geomonas sp.]|nr:chemotaxis protein CheW [Geomonas sp.]